MPEATGENNNTTHPGSANANHSSVSLVKNAPGAASRPALARKNSRTSTVAMNQAGLIAMGSKGNIHQSEDGLNGGSIQEFGEQQLYENTYKMKPDKK